MFPLKQRRRYARLENKKIIVNIVHRNNKLQGIISNISAGGCKIDLKDNSVKIDKGEIIDIEFKVKRILFKCKAKNIYSNSFEFIFDNKEMQSKLNLFIVREYLKDTPELIDEKFIK